MKKLAIVGIFYDGYVDLWEDFLTLFKKFWPDCPYPLYIVDNKLEPDFVADYGVKLLNAGAEAEYSQRVRTAVESIDADYFLILLEDFFLSKQLDADALEPIVNSIAEEGFKYYGMPYTDCKKIYKTPYNGSEYLFTIDGNRSRTDYTLTCQPCIWEREFLKECIGEGNYNAWVFEGIYARSHFAHEREFLRGCVVDSRNVLAIRHGALQQKMLPDTVEYYRSVGYEFKTDRPQIDEKQYKKILRKDKLRGFVPPRCRKIVKKFLGVTSVLDRYEEQIRAELERMGKE